MAFYNFIELISSSYVIFLGQEKKNKFSITKIFGRLCTLYYCKLYLGVFKKSLFISDLLNSLEDHVNVKRPFELVSILQNGQICFSGRNLGVRIPKDNPAQLPYYMALLGRMVDRICPASKGCILQG